ncbi:hypothetical protein F2Q69_00054687 [Brassica cretica]|uniref:Uncharacterized protein n=1 Tax=Brassica cretica TaxID=69181 RepID=A0A8S9N7Z8_BRACR|nr:hypothetical protein F2Q69_00054687 [Brassica cretica]
MKLRRVAPRDGRFARSLEFRGAERSLDFRGAERRQDYRGEEKRFDCDSTTTEEITGDCTATLPYAIREEKTEEEMNGEDTTPCTTGEERGYEIHRGERKDEEMRFTEGKEKMRKRDEDLRSEKER